MPVFFLLQNGYEISLEAMVGMCVLMEGIYALAHRYFLVFFFSKEKQTSAYKLSIYLKPSLITAFS